MMRETISSQACSTAGVMCKPDPMVFKNIRSAELLAEHVQDSMRITLNGELVAIAEGSLRSRWVAIKPLLKEGENTLLVQIDSRKGPVCTGTLTLRINGQEIPEQSYQWAFRLKDGKPGNCLTQMYKIELK